MYVEETGWFIAWQSSQEWKFPFFLIIQRELAELDKLREDYVTSKADEPESRDGDILGEDWEYWEPGNPQDGKWREVYRQSHLFGVPVGFKSNLLLSEASLC